MVRNRPNLQAVLFLITTAGLRVLLRGESKLTTWSFGCEHRNSLREVPVDSYKASRLTGPKEERGLAHDSSHPTTIRRASTPMQCGRRPSGARHHRLLLRTSTDEKGGVLSCRS